MQAADGRGDGPHWFAPLAAALAMAVLGYSVLSAMDVATLWLDETYSLLLALHDPATIVALAAADRHPPLYYLLLGGWLRLAPLPIVTAGRAFSIVVPGLLLAIGARWLGGRIGHGRAALLAVLVAANPMLGHYFAEVRGYALASVAGAGAVLLLCASSAGRPLCRREWTAYGLLAALACWTHLLGGLLLAIAGAWWLACLARRRAWAEVDTRRGLLASGLAALSLVPLFLGIERQLASFEGDAFAAQWLRAPGAWDLAAVFVRWLPWGEYGIARGANPVGYLLAGAAIVFFPAAAGLRAISAIPREDRLLHERIAAPMLGIGTLFVVLLWTIHAAGVAPVFYGPRYPVVGLGAFLVGWGACVVARLERSRRAGIASLVAILLVGLAAGVAHGPTLARRGFPELAAPVLRDVSLAGRTVFIVPGVLRDTYAGMLPGGDVQPIERLASSRPARFAVLDANHHWTELRSADDAKVLKEVESGKMGRVVDSVEFPSGLPMYGLVLVGE